MLIELVTNTDSVIVVEHSNHPKKNSNFYFKIERPNWCHWIYPFIIILLSNSVVLDLCRSCCRIEITVRSFFKFLIIIIVIIINSSFIKQSVLFIEEYF